MTAEQLVLLHRRLARKVGYEFSVRINKRWEAEECEQVALIACWEAAKKWDRRGSFGRWAKRCMTDALKSWMYQQQTIRVPKVMRDAAIRIRKAVGGGMDFEAALAAEMCRRNATSRRYRDELYEYGIRFDFRLKRRGLGNE